MNGASIRFRIDPVDVPPKKAARRLYLTLEQFRVHLPRLLARGFPMPDPTTGMYDLDAIDRWRHRRHAALFPEMFAAGLASEPQTPVKNLGPVFAEGMAEKRLNRPPRRSRGS